MTARRDVSGVPLQGGYVAKQCPVRAQNDALLPAEPLPPSPVLERRFERGRLFETEIVTDLLRLHPDAVVVDGENADAIEAATVAAMAAETKLILRARLPPDTKGRRVGKPDLLVAAARGGYRPVDIKHHMSLEPAEPERRRIAALCSTVDRPWFEDSVVEDAFGARKREGDLLQLAHYQRMLEAAGLAAPDGRHGGIIGVEHRVVWYDLDALIWRTPSSSDHQKSRTTMERYDFEFDFRLDIIATAGLHEADPTVDPLVVPVRVSECAECPWWGHCEPLLETGTGDVSLIPRIGWREWKIHQDHGTTDREALARLDVATACLVAAGVDVLSLIELVEGLPENTPLTELAVVAKKADLAMLEAAGVRTFGQVSQLSRATASYSGAGLSSLPEQIDMARAALGPAPVYRRRGVDTLFVPRAEIEVDIDMENIEEGVYLWGALVTDQSSASDHPSEYHAFVTWEPLTPEVEAANSLRFWNWLSGLRIDAQETGRSFHSYCYNASAENTYLRKLGLAAGILHEVAAFIASDDWIDMLRVFDRQLITGGGSGLKVVAPLAGFAWSVDDPGGGESMVRYDVAVSSPNDARRAEARHWLLTYNEGDVKATLALREWMDHAAPQATAIESLHSRS